jgi:large subunit ribosomal protein L16|tara:strand:+ start:2923 stop:3345 length:423 start_codon:yes stop_codon:yes gene_type:complete
MLEPKKRKFRKEHKGRVRGVATKSNKVSFGEFGLQSLDFARITGRQIEAARITITRKVRRGAKLWIRIFPHKPVTKKPAEVRMGKGKGDIDRYVAPIKKGTMLYEIAGVDEELAREALRLASNKLPVRTRVVARTRGQLT